MMDWMICMLILISLNLAHIWFRSSSLSSSWSNLNLFMSGFGPCGLSYDLIEIYILSCFNFAFQVGFSLSAYFWLMTYELKVVLSPKVWSFSLLFSWDIHYRRIPSYCLYQKALKKIFMTCFIWNTFFLKHNLHALLLLIFVVFFICSLRLPVWIC